MKWRLADSTSAETHGHCHFDTVNVIGVVFASRHERAAGLEVPSFQRFFYQNGQNSTFNQFLCKILTNKSTRKKFQLIEGTK